MTFNSGVLGIVFIWDTYLFADGLIYPGTAGLKISIVHYGAWMGMEMKSDLGSLASHWNFSSCSLRFIGHCPNCLYTHREDSPPTIQRSSMPAIFLLNVVVVDI